VVDIIAYNVPEAYVEAYWCLKTHGVHEDSRNGPVLTIPDPCLLTIRSPLQRVLFDPIRNANPFFHVMETIWMLAGEWHVGFVAKFNKTYVNYAEAEGFVQGAYGKRWRRHFGGKVRRPYSGGYSVYKDQILEVIEVLKENPDSRQAVIGMWDPSTDLALKKKWRDRPCNTHIYFRKNVKRNELDMTICNRSNDIIWGMLGANVVHMSYLHELVAFGAGVEIGEYRVFSNNAHVYTDREDVKRFMEGPVRNDPYTRKDVDYFPLIQEGETVEQLLKDCEVFVRDEENGVYQTDWINQVAIPMISAWKARVHYSKFPEMTFQFIDQIAAKDWRLACRQWTERKIQSSATSTGQSR
jgi:thymidylate synthase